MEEIDNGLKFHHVGYVVPSIRDAAENFAKSMALEWDGRIIHDPQQTVLVSFFRPRVAGNPTIELVEPVDDESAVYRFLKVRGGLHHLCYEVDSIEKQLAWCKAQRDLIVRRPMPALAFDGRRIAWVYTKTKLLVEYLEK